MKPKLLLHVCCVVCGGYLSRKLSVDFELTAVFVDSNIFPELEFNKRWKAIKDFLSQEKIELIETLYNHESWLKKIKGLETEPEKGKRCERCFQFRLETVAKLARDLKFDFFASTLSVSPHKNAILINQIGQGLAERFDLSFLAGDWKKEGGFKKAQELSRELNFYHQNYCGCEFSIRN